MLSRCRSTSNPSYKDYGGRGITVCDRWLTFQNFLDDMGSQPHGMTIDRIDNNKGYSPENCRWADMSQQRRNQRRVKYIDTSRGPMLLADMARIAGITKRSITERIERGWRGEKLFMPRMDNRQSGETSRRSTASARRKSL